MADYRLSKRAAADLRQISKYTIDRFGVEQAELYIQRLFRAFETVASYPSIGTDCGSLRRGVRRLAHDSHVTYYRTPKSAVVILRILGAEQDSYRHL